jgi:rSAM/selenodomain-associated transferase 2
MISIVIPALNEAEGIGACLEGLLQEACGHEVIVVDGGSRDGTPAVVRRFRQPRLLSAERGRGVQMNRGAMAASGDILLFLHADCRLPAGGLCMIEDTMADSSAVAGSFSLAFDRDHPLLRLYAAFSRINHILFTYGDQGLFLPRRTFQRIGGFREVPLMEDLEIQQRLRRMGRFVKIRRPMTTASRRFAARGILRQQFANTLLVTLYFAGVSPARLARFY